MPEPSAPPSVRPKWGARIGLALFTLVFGGGWGGLRWVNRTLVALERPASTSPTYKVVTIEPGMTPYAIATALWDHGLIPDRRLFVRYARWRRVDDQLKYGDYRLSTGLNTREVSERLVAGNVLTHRFTVREGDTVRDLARELERLGLADASTLMDLTADPAFLAQYGLNVASAEGYLFPETYLVAKGVAEGHLVELMLIEFQARMRALREELALAPYTPYEILKIASIIEKEALLESDMPLVAAVIYNRLERNMPLQCDVTIRYPLDNYGRHLTNAELEMDNPYNSYKYRGLPPTPICNPGIAAIQAALRPAEAEYLYFVSMNNGAHLFSHTYEEHKRAVRRFQIRNERGTTVPSSQDPHPRRPRTAEQPPPATEIVPSAHPLAHPAPRPDAPVDLARAAPGGSAPR